MRSAQKSDSGADKAPATHGQGSSPVIQTPSSKFDVSHITGTRAEKTRCVLGWADAIDILRSPKEAKGRTMVMMAFLSVARRALCTRTAALKSMLDTVSADTCARRQSFR